jgi:hypothetical protein
MMIITERLKHAIASGLLPPRIPEETITPVEKIADLLKDYSDFYTTQHTYEDMAGTRDIKLNHTNFVSIPRKSPEPLISTIKMVAPTKGMLEDVFTAAKGLWAYYEMKNKQNHNHLNLPMSDKNFEVFMKPLIDELVMTQVGHCFEDIEEIIYEGRFYIDMPNVHGDEDGAGTFQAFLEGPESVAGQLIHYIGEHDLDQTLSKDELDLIEEIGLVKLTVFYADYEGKKIVDLRKLENYFEYFEDIHKDYPQFRIDYFPLIDYGQGASLSLFNAAEIDCAVRYVHAWEKLTDDMPAWYHMEQNEEMANEMLITDICKVWREGHVSKSKV